MSGYHTLNNLAQKVAIAAFIYGFTHPNGDDSECGSSEFVAHMNTASTHSGRTVRRKAEKSVVVVSANNLCKNER